MGTHSSLQRSISARLVAVSCAAAVSGIFLLLLVPKPIQRSEVTAQPHTESITYLWQFQATRSGAQLPLENRAPKRLTAPSRRAALSAATPDSAALVFAPTPEPAGSSPAKENAAQPLQLDHATVARAIASSRSPVKRMAEGAGQELEAPPLSKSEQLAAGISEAGNPNCLHTNALKHDPPRIGPVVLGGAIPMVFLAHAALTGRCK